MLHLNQNTPHIKGPHGHPKEEQVIQQTLTPSIQLQAEMVDNALSEIIMLPGILIHKENSAMPDGQLVWLNYSNSNGHRDK